MGYSKVLILFIERCSSSGLADPTFTAIDVALFSFVCEMSSKLLSVIFSSLATMIGGCKPRSWVVFVDASNGCAVAGVSLLLCMR